MLNTSQRTQIYLPKKLRHEIDKDRLSTDESLAEYIRNAVRERIARKKKDKVSLRKLADKITRPKKSGWDSVDVIKWQREIRADRDIL